MTPPYKLVDQATGEDVPGFVGMDTEPGRFIEVYSGSNEGQPDARISAGALQRPGDPVPPDPNPEPPQESEMDYPRTQDELEACLNRYAGTATIGQLDPRTDLEITRPITIACVSQAGTPWGVDGNGAKLRYSGRGGDLLCFTGVDGVNNRGLTVRNLHLDGGDGGTMSGQGAQACLRLSAPLGDYGPIYKFTLENIFTSGAVNGIVLEGGVYEGECHNIHAENCTGDGVLMQHLNLGQPGQGVVSNVLVVHLNSSRNFGAGLRTVYSVNLVGGSFVLNGGGGVVAPEGIRSAIQCNGENTGGQAQAVFDVPNNGYGSVITMGEASSDGQTHCRKWDGSQWVSVGRPLLYFIAMGGNVTQRDNHTSYYGSGSDPMHVVKPGTYGQQKSVPGPHHARKDGDLGHRTADVSRETPPTGRGRRARSDP